MGAKRRRSDRALRQPMRSPGRPTVARREHRQRFWEAIARGASSEDAAFAADVSPSVGARWFHDSGGMSTLSFAPLSPRYLSFVEREEVALLHAGAFPGRFRSRSSGKPSKAAADASADTRIHGALDDF